LIAVPAGVRIHLALGATDMRRSFGPSRIQALELTEKYQAFLGG